MNRHIASLLVLSCVTLAWLAGCMTREGVRQSGALKLLAEVQFRPSIDCTLAYGPIKFPWVRYREEEIPAVRETGYFPIVEVFLTSREREPVELAGIEWDGAKVAQFPTDEVIWWQFYPTGHVKPGETVVLQVCLPKNPEARHGLTIYARSGKRTELLIPSYRKPDWQIVAVTFDLGFRNAFLAFAPYENADHRTATGLAPRRLAVNGEQVKFSVLEAAAADRPAMVSAELPQPLTFGQPVHVRLDFDGRRSAQCLLRASNGFSLDAYGVDEKDDSLRKELALDLRPAYRIGPEDPACEDAKLGASLPHFIETRRKLYEERENRLFAMFLCVAGWPQLHHPIYAQCVDALQANPYRLNYTDGDDDPRFIEKEENFFRWARLAACPRPWHYSPEVFLANRFERMLEPGELRSLVYAAIGHGAKGLNYYTYGSVADSYHGFQDSPGLLAEIKKLNAELQRLEPMLSTAVPVSIETVGDPSSGMRVYTLWCGNDGILAIARNLDYTTDREPNELGRKPRFQAVPKKNVEVTLHKPSWLNVAKAIDPLEAEKNLMRFQIDQGKIVLALKRLEVVKLAWLENCGMKTSSSGAANEDITPPYRRVCFSA